MSDDKFENTLAKSLTGWAFSMAILDDYCEVIFKIEGVKPDVVKDRITKNANAKFKKAIQD